jgi:hypothetical protein
LRTLLTGAAATLAFTATPASAQAWQRVAQSDNVDRYIDVDSIERMDGHRIRYRSEDRYPAGLELDGVRIDTQHVYVESDCAKMTLSAVEMSTSMRGQVVGAPFSPGAPPSVARPGTMGHSLVEAACRAAGLTR